MHGELIYTNEAGTQARLPGYAVLESEDRVRWEFHDRELDENEIKAALRDLSHLSGTDNVVQVVYVNPGQLLDEVESGPDHEVDLSEPIRYRVGEIHEEEGWLELFRSG